MSQEQQKKQENQGKSTQESSKSTETSDKTPHKTSQERMFEGKSFPGEQGIYLQPVGSHQTNPFIAQNVNPSGEGQTSAFSVSTTQQSTTSPGSTSTQQGVTSSNSTTSTSTDSAQTQPNQDRTEKQ